MTDIKAGSIITLHDKNNDQTIIELDVTNLEGSIMDYYYYYFDGYENYISYLMKRGALKVERDNKYLQCKHKVIPIYEIPKNK